MVEYLSFTCPHCAHFHAEVFPKLKGRIHRHGQGPMIEYHEVYFDQMGLLARDAGPMRRRNARYFGLTDMLVWTSRCDWAAAETH